LDTLWLAAGTDGEMNSHNALDVRFARVFRVDRDGLSNRNGCRRAI
jgi:hypothetical protein